jgi:hypothetical protein
MQAASEAKALFVERSNVAADGSAAFTTRAATYKAHFL